MNKLAVQRRQCFPGAIRQLYHGKFDAYTSTREWIGSRKCVLLKTNKQKPNKTYFSLSFVQNLKNVTYSRIIEEADLLSLKPPFRSLWRTRSPLSLLFPSLNNPTLLSCSIRLKLQIHHSFVALFWALSRASLSIL